MRLTTSIILQVVVVAIDKVGCRQSLLLDSPRPSELLQLPDDEKIDTGTTRHPAAALAPPAYYEGSLVNGG